MSSTAQKRNAYKVQIRRKRVQDKISQLRATYIQEHLKESDDNYSDSRIANIVNEALSSKEKLVDNISLVEAASFHVNQKNVQLFFPVIQDLCYILGHLEELKETPKTQNLQNLYNEITTILINISSNQAYQWPVGEYLPIIKNLLKKQCEINTMWLLSNILHQSQNPQVQQSLTRQLVKYDCITFCSQRLEKKFQKEQDINVFAYFVSSFLTNAEYLNLESYKRIIRVLENLSSLNLESIDLYIVNSMVDHAPHLARMNYELLYSEIITNFRERYVKKKKTKMILKYLEFVKTYIFTELNQSLNPQNQQFKDIKVAKNNYERISINVLPTLTLCLDNLSPDVKGNLLEISSMLLEFYFPFVDLENQHIFLTQAQGLSKNAASVLSKYSNRALYWQLRLVHILFIKIQEYKISTEIISHFLSENNILEAFSVLLKDKTSVIEIVQQITQLMLLLLTKIDKELLLKDSNSKYQYYLHSIKQTFQLILNNHLINDEDLHHNIEQIIALCEEKN